MRDCDPGLGHVVAALVLSAGALLLGGPAGAQNLPAGAAAPSPQEPEPGREPGEQAETAPPADDPTRTAGGALAAFMGRRHYLTIRELKAVMTPELAMRYDHDSVPFNGKRRIRIAAFDFTEKDLKPVPPPRTARGAKSGSGAGGAPGSAKAPSPVGAANGAVAGAAAPPNPYIATVQSLWEDQGEAVERRVETVKIVAIENGTWRVASLDRVGSEPLRFTDAIPGVTALRLLLRAWANRDPTSARPGLSPAFLKRYAGREAALNDLFAGGADPRHAAFQILEMTPQGATTVQARVRLFEVSAGRPSSLEGSAHTLKLVKKGPPWLLDSWD